MVKRAKIASLGEVLWDVFPNGAYFGGAPANFACCAAGLGGEALDVFAVSGVGPDNLGRRAIELLSSRHVDTRFVQQRERPTGQVLVQLDCKGHPSYQIAENTAWDDFIWTDELQQFTATCDVVCFGTLSQRSDTSRHTIHSFLESTRANCLRILDVNLRAPFWNKETLLQSLAMANVVKLNDAELAIIADVLGWKATEGDAADRLLQEFSLDVVAVTRGEHGALLTNSRGERSDLQVEPVAVVDTVGAGDAYTAALVIGLLRGYSLASINDWATRVAGFVCTQQGAAPEIPAELRQP